MPEVAPPANAATRNRGTDDDAPNQTVAAALAKRPLINRVRRPIRSDRWPLGITTTRLPSANIPSTKPVIRGPRPNTSETKSGTTAIRNPNTAQPVAKFDTSAERYARCLSAARTVTAGSACSAGAPSVDRRKLQDTAIAVNSTNTA